jgi:hypothetical protein
VFHISNRHLDLSGITAGSRRMLNGLERTNLLRKMGVRLGDVQPGNEFGVLVLGGESRSVAKFEREMRVF